MRNFPFLGLSFAQNAIFALFLSVFLSGCLRIALPVLPPQLATTNLDSTKIVFLISPEAKARIVSEESEIVGHQYVFGFFPLTRLALTSSKKSFVLELLIKALLEKGFYPIVLSENSLKALSKEVLGYPQLRYTEAKISVNAYDLLFLRRAVVETEFLLSFSFAEVDASWFDCPILLKEARFKTSAHAPFLFSLLETSLLRELRVCADSLIRKQRIRRRFKQSLAGGGRAKTLLLEMPRFETSFLGGEGLGQKVSDAFGYPKLPATSLEGIRRLIQRGFANSLAEFELLGFEVFSSNEALPFNSWELQSEVTKLLPKSEAVALGLRFSLFEEGALLSSGSCEVEQSYLNEEAQLFRAIGMASRELLAAFLRGEGRESSQRQASAVCRFDS